ncbi:hypothetical protein PH505_aj00180 [Pseudoalteromonas distincta]|nr:hypothetical protein PH505_aj00180 [Pseudoalteromonas distincta]
MQQQLVVVVQALAFNSQTLNRIKPLFAAFLMPTNQLVRIR